MRRLLSFYDTGPCSGIHSPFTTTSLFAGVVMPVVHMMGLMCLLLGVMPVIVIR